MTTSLAIPPPLYLHSLHFAAWNSIPCMGPHHSHVPTFTEFHCVGSIPCVGDHFALRALSPSPCTYINCVSLHGFQFPAWVPTTYCVGSIPCVGDLFALRALFPPPCNYIHCMGFKSLHESPPLPRTYIHCVSLCGFNSLCG